MQPFDPSGHKVLIVYAPHCHMPLHHDESTGFQEGKIVRGEDPLNLEMPFEMLDGFITPTESFYVRTHFPIPKIDKNKWRLRVEGEVEKPFAIDYDELLKIESRTIPVTLECAGNNRIFLEPKVKGVQWGFGAVGNAEWTGAPCSRSKLLRERTTQSNAGAHSRAKAQSWSR